MGIIENETKKNTVSSSTLRERAYFVSGMLVKCITRAEEECKLDITLACFLRKSTLRTSSVIGGGGHAPQQNYWVGQCSPQFCCHCNAIKRLFLPLEIHACSNPSRY